MHRLRRPAHWRPLLSFMSSATDPRRWCFRLMDPRFPHGFRSITSGSGGVLGSGEEELENVGSCDTTKEFIDRCGYGRPASVEEGGRRTSLDVSYGGGEARREVLEDSEWMTTDGSNGEAVIGDDEVVESWATEIHDQSVDWVVPLNILPYSSHRDGSIFRDTDEWKKEFRIVDRSETRLEAMMLANPTDDCSMEDGVCRRHRPRRMVQIFSLKLSKIPVHAGSVELYGYIAARDDLDGLLNYVVNISRDDPIIVEQGSLINMVPKRGIKLGYETLMEYDMKIKTGGSEKDDLQLIDGVSVIDTPDTFHRSVFTCRIHGDCGAIDISASRLDEAVEATVEVIIPEVQGSFNMSLGCFTSKLDKEIQLFDGTIVEPRGLGRSVVAVVMRTQMHLKFKIGSEPSGSSEYCCSFMPHCHGHATELVKTGFASISVKVTWSSLPCRWTTLHTLLERYAHDK